MLTRTQTALLADVDLSESDRAVLNDPGVRETLRAAIREMFAAGVWVGWTTIGQANRTANAAALAFVQPWGFDLQELRVPVEIRYGVTDVLVPAAHADPRMAYETPAAST